MSKLFPSEGAVGVWKTPGGDVARPRRVRLTFGEVARCAREWSAHFSRFRCDSPDRCRRRPVPSRPHSFANRFAGPERSSSCCGRLSGESRHGLVLALKAVAETGSLRDADILLATLASLASRFHRRGPRSRSRDFANWPGPVKRPSFGEPSPASVLCRVLDVVLRADYRWGPAQWPRAHTPPGAAALSGAQV